VVTASFDAVPPATAAIPQITLVGEATTLSEAIQKTEELHPDEIILNLHMAHAAKPQLSNGTKLLAISFANDVRCETLRLA
jgi:DNA-binding NarL/FixJ family response regulator